MKDNDIYIKQKKNREKNLLMSLFTTYVTSSSNDSRRQFCLFLNYS